MAFVEMTRNLPMLRAKVFPQPAAEAAKSAVLMLIAHSLVCFNMLGV
jgi:hypothetical protein